MIPETPRDSAMLKTFATALLAALTTAASWAHPGRTDARGCHTCRTNCAKWGLRTGEYHCHNAPPSTTSSPATPSPKVRTATPPSKLVSSASRSKGNFASLVRLSIPIYEVLNGDTLVAIIDGRQRVLHLFDVDAPEMEQPFGEMAKSLASALLLDKTAEVAVIGSTSSGGLWVRVAVDDQDLAKLLLDAGLAWCRPGVEDDSLRRREYVARVAKIGLWVQEQPEPPWTFRLAQGDS